MSFAVGTLVKARGREWVVLPDTSDQLIRVKPLGAPDLETTAIVTALETVVQASFALPNPERLGDTRSARMLRDAVRLGFRACAGPFRSLGSVAVEPRPYQLVPLLMALRQDPVRLLIADDVGIGKTIEAALIAKELISRGEADRLCVLCPPHLAEQWQSELNTKFNMESVLVHPGTVARLENQVSRDSSIFEHFPVTVVSLDYIKSDRRRHDFLRTCPDLVIVDEAHTCTLAGLGAQQQRYHLLKSLSDRPQRHLVLVTATPHSGNEQAFRSMLSLLKRGFEDLPNDLSGDQNRANRERLAAHFVQRRRADIEHYLREDTPFPARQEKEITYKLHPEYRDLLNRALKYAQEVVADKTGTRFQQRIRWWSALALLRSISSSPAAAAATLRNRAANADSEDAAEIEQIGRDSVMDVGEAEAIEATDVVPGADVDTGETPTRRRLLEMARSAEKLIGDKDRKLLGLVETVKGLLAEGYRPIVFCKYIPTAVYIAEEVRKRLRGVEVACVTGQLPHDEREDRVLELANSDKRVLVCTDCLSEGINLQEYFDAVVHADLAWSPTRHEQREGRVDRFNQRSSTVRVVTYFGEDNPIDGIVLQILLNKHKRIRKSTGVSVPVPINTDKVLEAIFEALLLKGIEDSAQLSFAEELELPERKQLDEEWDRAADREKKSRTMFAQHTIKPDEVQPELDAVREALGSPMDVERFVRDAVRAHGGRMEDWDVFTLDLTEAPLALRDGLRFEKPFKATFKPTAPRDTITLTRTHPFTEALASYVMDSALGEDPEAVARRCGVTATDAVSKLTTILILRFRFRITSSQHEMLAEDTAIVGFEGAPQSAKWFSESDAETLLAAAPKGNIAPDQARHFLRAILSGIEPIRPAILEIGKTRAQKVLTAHRRVRQALDGSHAAKDVKLQGQPDVLGLYILTPVGGIG